MWILPETTEFAKFLMDMGDGILNDSKNNIQLSDCCIAPIDINIVQNPYINMMKHGILRLKENW